MVDTNSNSSTIAFVTGATQGIGLEVARILAKKHGYHVIIGARKIETGKKIADDLKAAGHNASALQLDLTSEVSIQECITSIELKFGRLDVLVNNAAVLLDSKPSNSHLSTFELFKQTFMTNVIGTAALTDGLIPLLRKSTAAPARLVFVSSRMGSLEISTDKTTAWYPIDYKAYDASKAALNMLMLNYARIMDGTGARVNCVCPGYVKTSLTLYTEYGTSPEVGAEKVVEMATLGEDGPVGIWTSALGPIPW
jgi:NAD(P)-dependent dehydrogenase (short-subunit alcohol dehydrogenase family)